MKLLKSIAKRRARKGFTLVELVVVIAIIAILMACVVAFATPIRSMMSNTNARSDAITINNCLGNYIERRLAFANDIKVFVGEHYYSSNQTAAYANMYNQHHSANDSPRMMIFEFDTTEGNFKVYDLPITSETMPPEATTMVPVNLVYNNDFYGNYTYFITCDNLAPEINPMKHKAYLNFRIDSYDFGDSGSKITQDNVKDYYNFITNKTGTNPLDQYAIYRSGSENVSFGLENIPVSVKFTQQKDSTGKPMTDTDGNPIILSDPEPTPNATVTRPSSPTETTAGYDMVVLYNVRKYSVSDVTIGK